MTRTAVTLGLLGGLALAGASTHADPAGPTLPTSYTVLVGFPLGEEAVSTGVLLVPGTVIPVGAEGPPGSPAEELDVVEESLAFTRVVEKLWRTFRLDLSRQLQQGRYVQAAVSQSVELPAPSDADVSLSGELVGFDASVATYRVVFRQGGQVLADSTVNVDRGGRAVVGGMDGERAPYIFVVIEPDPPRSRPVPFDEQAGFTEPVKTAHVNPVYPKSAKEERVQGIVLLSAALDTEGTPSDIRVLRSPDPRLSAAALEAARQWRWEPARTNDGTPIAVYFTLTFNFLLK
jgi:TonB family protein